MILIVVAAFAISWTPYFLITIITQYSNVNYMSNHNYFFSMLLINLFAFLNSSINPFIYAIMSSRFRTGFISILRFLFCAHSTDGANNSINGSNPINSNQLIDGAQVPPNNHRFRGRSAIARYHRQMVLMVCRGPTQVSTDSLPPTESPNHRNDCTNHVTINPTHELDTFRFVDNDHDHDPNHEFNHETNFEGKQVVSRFPSNEHDNETILKVVVNNNDQTTLTNHVIHNVDANNLGDAKISDADERDANNPGDAKISDADEKDANTAEDSGSLNKMSSDREIAKELNGPRRDRVKIAGKYSDSVDSKENSAKQGVHKKFDCCERPDAVDEARSRVEDNDERQDNGRYDRNRFGIYKNQAGMDAIKDLDANKVDASKVDASKDLDAG